MTESPLLDPSGNASPFIHETTAESFEQDVMVRSQELPIVLDFWAPWCDPCRQLTPLLEKLVVEDAGRWLLVKINIDDCQELAQAFGVESIPLLVAFLDGQPVDSAPGVQTEEQLREWLARFVPSHASVLVADGDALEATEPAQAAAKYREALMLEPDNSEVKIRLARVAMTLDDTAGAAALVGELEERGFLEPEAQALKDQLDVTNSASLSGGVDSRACRTGNACSRRSGTKVVGMYRLWPTDRHLGSRLHKLRCTEQLAAPRNRAVQLDDR